MNLSKPTKTIVTTIVICTCIVFASISSVTASNYKGNFDEPRGHQGNMHKIQRMAKALSLSEEQKVQIKEIKNQGKEQHQALRALMKKFKNTEKKLVQTEIFDEAAFTALHNEYQPIFSQSALIRAKNKHAVFNVLTAEQQEKWLKIIKRHNKKIRG